MLCIVCVCECVWVKMSSGVRDHVFVVVFCGLCEGVLCGMGR